MKQHSNLCILERFPTMLAFCIVIFFSVLLTPPTIYCSDVGNSGTKQKQDKPLSSQSDTLTCDQLYEEGQILATPDGEFLAAGDTLKYYVEHCYQTPDFNMTVFSDIASDIAGQHPGGDTLSDLRKWFFSVLYLVTDTENSEGERYYCNDAIATISTFNNNQDTNGIASVAAIEKYLVVSGKCPDFQAYLNNQISQLYQGWHRIWKDTVTDSLLTPWDTTLPTLQQIGFEILLGPQNAVASNGIIPTSVLGTIGIAPNPFTDNTVIDYTLNVPATLTVEVFNVLGQKVASPVSSVFTINGNYSLTLSGSALATGTYYVRFSVPEGEVRTIMITKE
jgi:hypothetical protein